MKPSLISRGSPERTVESLYRDYAADVYRYALAVLGSPADAEDVTQATFLNAFRAIERGERPRQPGAWLRVIAHNLCLQQFRQASRRPQQVELDEDAGELVADEQAPTLQDLMRGLKQVPFNQRAALVMREFEGRGIAEIAEIIGVSTSAVETLLFRARRSLREQLEQSLTCIEAERAISRQLDGLLPRGERGALRAHLRECKDCATHAKRLRAQRSSMRSLAVVPLPAALAWSQIGGGATGGAAGGAAAGAGSAAAGAGAPFGASLVAKLAAAALATSAIGGLGYVGVANHVFGGSPHRTNAATRAHAAANRNARHAGSLARRRFARGARAHHGQHVAPAVRVVTPAAIAPAIPVVHPGTQGSVPTHTPAHTRKPTSVTPKRHIQAKPHRPAHKQPASPKSNARRPKLKPQKPAPSGPPTPPSVHGNPDHSNVGKGPTPAR